MEFKSLDEHNEIEVNANGEVRWKSTPERSPTLYYGKVYNSFFLKYCSRLTNKNKSISMFNLVAKVFVDNPNNYKYVQTIDGDNSNYKAANLRWVRSRRLKVKPVDD